LHIPFSHLLALCEGIQFFLFQFIFLSTYFLGVGSCFVSHIPLSWILWTLSALSSLLSLSASSLSLPLTAGLATETQYTVGTLAGSIGCGAASDER